MTISQRGNQTRVLPHNPDVQPHRMGYSVKHDDGKFIAWLIGFTAHTTKWCAWKDAAVFNSLESAQDRAEMRHGCMATSVPRWNGHCIEYTEFPKEAA